MRAWTPDSVHEALLQWGLSVARQSDGGRGYPKKAPFVGHISRSAEWLSTGGVSSQEFGMLESAIERLALDMRRVVVAWYVPARREKGAHTQAVVAGALGIARTTMQDRLLTARVRIAATLNGQPVA